MFNPNIQTHIEPFRQRLPKSSEPFDGRNSVSLWLRSLPLQIQAFGRKFQRLVVQSLKLFRIISLGARQEIDLIVH